MAQAKNNPNISSLSSSYSSSSWETSHSSNLEEGEKKATKPPSRTFTIADEQTKEILKRLREAVNLEEIMLQEENKVDQETQALNINRLIEENRKKREEREGEEDELATDPTDRLDEIRLARLEETRPAWLNCFLKSFFHIMVFANFFTSWYDTARLLLEDAKMHLWLLEDDFNCLDIVPNVDFIDHSINIMHALLSCSVLYVQKRNSATLCLAWVSSQAVYTVFKTFQYLYNLKFEREAFQDTKWVWYLTAILLFNAFGALLLLHKYYDLTDRFRTRAKHFGTTDTDERSLNDRILYKNYSGFLQRKNILRDVTIAQTYAIIKKIGKHAKQGLPVDSLSLDREVNAARLALAGFPQTVLKRRPTT